MQPPANELNISTLGGSRAGQKQGKSRTLKGRTRRIYDLVSGIYPASTYFFHSRAHKLALEMSGIRDGMRVLEIATGSGEMFDRLVSRNTNGYTLGIDLSPNMAAKTQRHAQKNYPGAKTLCQAVDARMLPFADTTFDAVFCCYLFELLSTEDIVGTLSEIRRVLRPKGTFTTVLIGQNTELFNKVYHVAGSLAPAFWGRQVENGMPKLIKERNFRIEADVTSRQSFYPSRVLCCRRD